MIPLLALDIDGTLADTAHLAPLWDEDPAAWEAAIERRDYQPHAAAVEALAGLPLATMHVMLVTARSESLRTATRYWLRDAFPSVWGAALFMRRRGDDRPAWQVKREHLEAVRAGRDVVLVDDHEEAHRALTRDGDVHLRAPGEWHLLRQALGVR